MCVYVCMSLSPVRVDADLRLLVRSVLCLKCSLFYRALLQKRPIIPTKETMFCGCIHVTVSAYGVASIRRLLKIIGLFCKT